MNEGNEKCSAPSNEFRCNRTAQRLRVTGGPAWSDCRFRDLIVVFGLGCSFRGASGFGDNGLRRASPKIPQYPRTVVTGHRGHFWRQELRSGRDLFGPVKQPGIAERGAEGQRARIGGLLMDLGPFWKAHFHHERKPGSCDTSTRSYKWRSEAKQLNGWFRARVLALMYTHRFRCDLMQTLYTAGLFRVCGLHTFSVRAHTCTRFKSIG